MEEILVTVSSENSPRVGARRRSGRRSGGLENTAPFAERNVTRFGFKKRVASADVRAAQQATPSLATDEEIKWTEAAGSPVDPLTSIVHDLGEEVEDRGEVVGLDQRLGSGAAGAQSRLNRRAWRHDQSAGTESEDRQSHVWWRSARSSR